MLNGSTSGFARIVVVAFVVAGFLFSMTPQVKADQELFPELIITVGDTVGSSGEQNSVITVFMNSFADSVVAFELWLKVGNTFIMEFQTDTATVFDTTFWVCQDTNTAGLCSTYIATDADTTYWICNQFSGPDCIDSTQVIVDSAWDFFVVADSIEATTSLVEIGSVDTAGTMVSGWEYLDARSVFGNGTEIKITGVADRFSVPGTVPGIAPTPGGGVLVRVLADIFPMDDTTTVRTSAIVPDPFRDNFGFSRPDGTRIGEVDSIRVDTSLWRCDSWVPPDSQVCLGYSKVFDPPFDSVSVDSVSVTYLDTSKVWLIFGSLTVLSGICGQLDNDPLGEIDIGDLTFLISYLFINGAAPVPLEVANMDCAGSPPNQVDIGDLTWLISYLFINGPAPCSCSAP